MSYVQLPFDPGELTIVSKELIREIPTEVISEIGLTALNGNSVIPTRVVNAGNRTTVWCDDGRNSSVGLSVTEIPDMYPFEPQVDNPPAGNIVAFRHRKGGQSKREDHLRLLRLAGSTDIGYPSTEFYVGTHDDHPGQFGVYIRAEHVGFIGLSYLDTGRMDGFVALKKDEVRMKYFPIGPSAAIGLAS